MYPSNLGLCTQLLTALETVIYCYSWAQSASEYYWILSFTYGFHFIVFFSKTVVCYTPFHGVLLTSSALPLAYWGGWPALRSSLWWCMHSSSVVKGIGGAKISSFCPLGDLNLVLPVTIKLFMLCSYAFTYCTNYTLLLAHLILLPLIHSSYYQTWLSGSQHIELAAWKVPESHPTL